MPGCTGCSGEVPVQVPPPSKGVLPDCCHLQCCARRRRRNPSPHHQLEGVNFNPAQPTLCCSGLISRAIQTTIISAGETGGAGGLNRQRHRGTTVLQAAQICFACVALVRLRCSLLLDRRSSGLRQRCNRAQVRATAAPCYWRVLGLSGWLCFLSCVAQAYLRPWGTGWASHRSHRHLLRLRFWLLPQRPVTQAWQ